MRQTRLETVLEEVSSFLPDPKADGSLEGGQILSLLYPKIAFEGDMDKFELAKKNLLSATEEERYGPEAMRAEIRRVVESLSPDDLQRGGFAVFTDCKRTHFADVDNSPRPRFQLGGAALTLPVLVDARQSHRFWIAVLDVEAPRLLHVVDGVVKDETPKEVSTLTETMQQYHPMADVVWHSSSSVRRTGIRQQFHALGTATDDLRKDEITRVLMSFAKQVADIVEGPDPLILAGGPSRIGHFKEHFEHQNLIDREIQAAGDALDGDELLDRAFALVESYESEKTTETARETDTSNALHDLDEIRKAALRGRIDTVLLHPDHTGLLLGEDERVKFPDSPDEELARRSEAVSYALKNGAALQVTRTGTESAPVVATTRYD